MKRYFIEFLITCVIILLSNTNGEVEIKRHEESRFFERQLLGDLFARKPTKGLEFHTEEILNRLRSNSESILAELSCPEYASGFKIGASIIEFTLEPIKVEWDLLMDISYELRYNKEIEMEIYEPVFGKAQLALDGKEVIIEGYVIPFEEDDGFLALSANPYASCFFCGEGSAASVISMYVKDKDKKYKVDDFKEFRGTLHLNVDDPEEFYYILRDARER